MTSLGFPLFPLRESHSPWTLPGSNTGRSSEQVRNMDRLNVVFRHVTPSVKFEEVAASSSPSDDIVVVQALRTPIGKAKRGSFKDTYGDELLSQVFSAVIKDVGVNPRDIGDICVGTVLDPGNSARLAQFYSGIPETVPCMSVNRQCSSGLQAFMNVAGSIRNGQCDVGLAGGMEAMSKNEMSARNMNLNPRAFEEEKASQCLIPMGITSENVAARFGISREKQDRFSLQSHQKAHKAAVSGHFDAELVPVTTKIKDKEGNEKTITVRKDDGIRPSTTIEGLARLRPAFKEGGSTTAGNSSQVSDGAAAVLVTKRSEAMRRGWPILGVLKSYAVAGCSPDIMGIGPSVAIPPALQKAGLSVNDIDIYEINEAFASQAVYCVEKLGIPMDRVNPKGGAIALGHPLGCTGARQIGTLLHEMKRRGKPGYGVVSMCIGTGMGAAAVFHYPG